MGRPCFMLISIFIVLTLLASVVRSGNHSLTYVTFGERMNICVLYQKPTIHLNAIIVFLAFNTTLINYYSTVTILIKSVHMSTCTECASARITIVSTHYIRLLMAEGSVKHIFFIRVPLCMCVQVLRNDGKHLATK